MGAGDDGVNSNLNSLFMLAGNNGRPRVAGKVEESRGGKKLQKSKTKTAKVKTKKNQITKIK